MLLGMVLLGSSQLVIEASSAFSTGTASFAAVLKGLTSAEAFGTVTGVKLSRPWQGRARGALA